MKPLEGMLILDFSQYLAGPSAALRLADFGARVIKIESSGGGDNGRRLKFKNKVSDGDSLFFHTVNRNKESFAADLENKEDLELIKKLLVKADVIIENFRPGMMEKLGLEYEEVRAMNDRIIYGSVTGYGRSGLFREMPDQDLNIQALSGFVWLNGDGGREPMPAALAIAEIYAGMHLTQGILACLLRRNKSNIGGKVEVSLLESMMDLQFEAFGTYLNDGHLLPKRSRIHNAHAYLGAPYGIYPTGDHYIAISMGSVAELGKLLEEPRLLDYKEAEACFENRDEIKEIIEAKLKQNSTEYWLNKLENAGYWCSEVLNWSQLVNHPGFEVLNLLIDAGRPDCESILTTRCPIRFNGSPQKTSKWAPRLGEDTEAIMNAYHLQEGAI